MIATEILDFNGSNMANRNTRNNKETKIILNVTEK